MSDWKTSRLKKIVDITSGGTPLRSNESYWGGKIPWVKTSALNFNRLYSSEEKITKEGLENSSAKLFEQGTVLIALYGQGVTRGKTAILEFEATTNQACAALTSINEEELSNEYLFYYLTSSYKKLRHLSNQGGQENLSARLLKGFKIQYPSIQTQLKIIDILSTWDSAITTFKNLIQAKKRYKKGLMQQLLSGKKRFPEFEGEWQEIKLKNFFKYYSNKNKDDEDLPVMSCSKVYGITRQENIFNNRVASKDISGYKIIEKDDLVYDPMLLWDASIGFVKEVEKGVISPAYYTFKFKEGSAYRPFFEFVFGTHYMKYNYKAISQGTNTRRRKAPREAFLKTPVKIPKPIEEQKKIADTLLAAQEEIELLKEQMATIKKQKKGLMQQLLTGKVRVKKEEQNYVDV